MTVNLNAPGTGVSQTGSVEETSAPAVPPEAGQEVQTTGSVQGGNTDVFDTTPSNIAVQVQAMEGEMSPQTQALLNSLSPSSQTLMGTFGPELGALMEQSGGTALSSGLQSRWSEFIAQVGNEKGALVDINSLVQAVLRDAYMENTKDLHFYAQKVRYFNEMKKLIRNNLTEMRDFQVKFTSFYNSLETDTDGNLTAESQGQLALWLEQNSTNPLMTGIYTKALNKGVGECLDDAETLISNAYGDDVSLPDEIRTKLENALTTGGPGDVFAALETLAQFLSYLGDCGVANGTYGSGSGTCNDATHDPDLGGYGENGSAYDPDKAWDDFEYYMTDSSNDTARGNLASGDITIIEAAFGVDLGLSGSSSVYDVVNAAFQPVNDKWIHDIIDNTGMNSADIMQDLATNGVNSTFAIETYGSAEAAAAALAASVNCSSAEEKQMRDELGMWDGVPPAGCNSPDSLDNEIQKWEEKLNSIGDDAQLANVDLQNMLQKQQQTLQMMSNISKMLHDTAMAVLRKIGG
jgi:hypothetical protein